MPFLKEDMVVKQLLPTAKDRLATINEDAMLKDTAKLLEQTHIGLVVVCDTEGTMVGIISKSDIVRHMGVCHGETCAISAAGIMVRNVTFCRPNDPVHNVLSIMRDRGLVHLPIVDEYSRPLGVLNARDALGALLTITETSLSHAKKMESVGRAVTTLAHDFKNILNPIASAVGILKRITPSNDSKIGSLLDMIARSASDGRAIIEDVLAFIHKAEPQPEKIDVNILLEQLEEVLHQSIPKNILKQNIFDPSGFMVFTDSSLLQRAILNLVVNACDAMPQGGTLTIETAAEFLNGTEGKGSDNAPPGKYVRLSIRDTGKGMPPEVLQNIYQAFFTTKQLGKGTGLGIPMVVDFIRLSNGRMTIESKIGEGTTVNLFLPVILKKSEIPLRAAG